MGSEKGMRDHKGMRIKLSSSGGDDTYKDNKRHLS